MTIYTYIVFYLHSQALANDIERIQNVKDVISACCIAEKQIQRLLDTVNEALSLNDIEETFEVKLLHFTSHIFL